MSAADDVREMPESHNAILHQCLGLLGHEPLPEKLVQKYWELKRIFDRTGTIMRSADFAIFTWQMGYGRPTAKEEAPVTVVDMWRKKQIKPEETIQVKWRQKWVDAVFKSVNAYNEVIAQVVGEADERKFKAEDVKLAAA